MTYALPLGVLQSLLPPGLELDTYEKISFVAAASVQTRGLKPTLLPRLRILRSDTDKPLMSLAGNFLKHCNYRLAKVGVREAGSHLEIKIAPEVGRICIATRMKLP